MKRVWTVVLLLALALAGCKGVIPNEYLSVSDHDDPFSYRETTEPVEETEAPIPSASNYYSMRTVLQSFVTGGVEHGQLWLVNYDGDVEQDLKRVIKYLTTEDPVAAYATDYINCERYAYRGDWMVSVDMVFRRSAREIEAIEPVRGVESALARMIDALSQGQSSVTLQISGYAEEDLEGELYRYCMEHPDLIVEIPEISVACYPDDGNVRVVETHFTYSDDSQSLRGMRAEVEAVLVSAKNYVHYAQTDEECLNLIAGYLTSRFRYSEDKENASVYSLLCQGVGDSRSFAAVVRYLCAQSELECLIVEGFRAGEPYFWNIVCVDEVHYHVDLLQDALVPRTLSLLTDEEMEGYEWDTETYPRCDGMTAAEEEPENEP